jgi:serine/threonine protein kinase
MANTLTPGFLLNGRYRIVERVGAGGMGAVYKATDTSLGGRMVAVKEMSEEGLSSQEIAEATTAFQQEANLLASLHHHSLPAIYDYFTADERSYLVMEFIEGQTLEKYLLLNGTPGLPVDEVLLLADQICGVLEYLHGFSPPIIFRDLTPSNIMLTPDYEVYLIDFGIARIFKPGKSRDTVAMGKDGYAPPEQSGKAQTTVRSDIYSFGATLHEQLTGIDPADKPFTFAPIQPLNPETPPRLEALIMWMVQLDESKRPIDIVVIRHELDQIASELHNANTPIPAQQLPPPIPSVPLYPVPPTPIVVAYPSVPVPNRRRQTPLYWILGSLGAILVICCGVSVFCSSIGALGQSPADSTAAAQSQDTADAQSTLSAYQSNWGSDEDTLSSDENTLNDEVTSLEQASDFSSTLAAYAKDWKQMQQDYQKEQQDYQEGCGSYGSNQGTVSYDASEVNYDLSEIQYDDSSLSYYEDGFNNALQSVQADITTVQSDLQTLENDAPGSTGDASVTSSENAANAALAAAQQQITTSNQALQSAQATAKKYDQEAAAMNTKAQNLANSMHC